MFGISYDLQRASYPMHDERLILLGLFFLVVLLLGIILFLIRLTLKSTSSHQEMFLLLLQQQLVENQSLRNQILAKNVPELLGLNHATLPVQATASNEKGSEPIEVDLGEAINSEEALARQGYYVGDLGGLESSGWTPPILKRDGSSDPIAFDPSL